LAPRETVRVHVLRLPARVTRCVCEKLAQNVAQPIFLSKSMYNFYCIYKSSPKTLLLLHFPRISMLKIIAQLAKIRPIWSPCSQQLKVLRFFVQVQHVEQRNVETKFVDLKLICTNLTTPNTSSPSPNTCGWHLTPAGAVR
jgi:hypothetical protein